MLASTFFSLSTEQELGCTSPLDLLKELGEKLVGGKKLLIVESMPKPKDLAILFVAHFSTKV